MHRRIFFSVAATFILAGANAEASSPPERWIETSDSIRTTIFFRVNESTVDGSYMGNSERLDALGAFMLPDTSLRKISAVVTATASPEGRMSLNRKLAAKRAAAVVAFFRETYPNTEISIGDETSIAYDWSSMRRIVEEDTDIPYREWLLPIIDDPLLDDTARESQIRALGGGSAYDYLKKNVLNHLRTGVITVTARRITTVVLQEPPVVCEPRDSVKPVPPAAPAKEPCRFALRTNLLFDLVGAPNLGVEFPVGKHFSLGADAAYAFWRIDNLYALQTIQGSVEAKYWFKPSRRGVLTGWSVGVYGIYCSRYDVQWRSGYQGDGFWSAGLSAGYSFPLSKRLNLEFAIAGGYFHTPEVRSYTRPENGHLMWKETRYNVGRFSLTKLQLNLVWFIAKNRKGGAR